MSGKAQRVDVLPKQLCIREANKTLLWVERNVIESKDRKNVMQVSEVILQNFREDEGIVDIGF